MEPELAREEAEAQSSSVTGLRSTDQTQETQQTRNARNENGPPVTGPPVAVEKDVRRKALGFEE